MGLSWSKRFHHRHHHHHHHDDDNHLPPPPPPSFSTSLNPSPPTPTPPPPSSYPPRQPSPTPPPPSFAFAANAPYPSPPPPQTTYPTLPPPPPRPPAPYTPPNNNYSYNYSNYSNYARPITTQPTYQPYFITPPPPPNNAWPGFRPAPRLPLPGPPPLPLPAVPYVDHQSAKKIKNDINVRKDSIRLQVDELNHDCHLVCFTFDAMVDGSITILYFAKEGANCTFTSVYSEIKPVKIPFQKGIGQKFCQPSGSGIDLGFFDIDDLSKQLRDDIFPLAIVAESTLPSLPVNEQNHEQSVNSSAHAQITLAVLEKKNESQFQVKVIKQILWIDKVRYELREIYGISNSDEATISSDQDTGKECVICMTEPKDTTVLPCRHMCMCSECAKALRLQSNKCPICRQPIEELLEIKVDEE